MTYHWRTMDELSRQEARRIRQQAGGTLMDENSDNVSRLALGGSLLFLSIVVAASGVVLLAIPIWIITMRVVFGKPSTNQAVQEGFDDWLKWRKDREDKYYGMFRMAEWMLVRDSIIHMADSQNIKVDMWTCKFHHQLARMEPEDYLIQMSDGSYDYGKYFEELAYRHHVMCYRYGYTPHIINWAEGTSHGIWDTYTDYRTPDFRPVVNSCGKETYALLPFEKYPINAQQQWDLQQFDYRTYENGGEWVKGIWSRAEARFEEDKEKYGCVEYPNPSSFIKAAEKKCMDSYFVARKPHKDCDRVDRELAYKDYKNA